MNAAARNKFLRNWTPYLATIKLLHKNGVSNEMIHRSVHYLKSQDVLRALLLIACVLCAT